MHTSHRRRPLPLSACAATLGAALALTACSPGAAPEQASAKIPTAWVLKSPMHAMLTQWTQSGGAVSGTIDEAFPAPAGLGVGAGEIKNQHNGLTGTISDGKITFTTDGGRTITGTIDANTLHLSVPDNSGLSQIDLHPGSPDDYTKATADMKTGIVQTAEKAAGVQASSDATAGAAKYRDGLVAVKTATAAVSTAKGAASTARDTFLASRGTFTDYATRAIAGSCWTQAQFDKAEELYNAEVTYYDTATARLGDLRAANQALDTPLAAAGDANAAVVAANGRLQPGAQVKIPDDGGVIAAARAVSDDATSADASMQAQVKGVLDQSGKLIDGFPASKFCS